MSGTEWDDDDGDDPAAAPLPPHERTWRHPSELGPPPVLAGAHTSPAFGRSALIGAGVVSVALVFGLIQLLLPRSGTTVSSEGTQALTNRTSALSSNPTLSTSSARRTTTTRAPERPAVTSAASTIEMVATTAAVPVATNSVSTLMLLAGKRAAVPIGDGRRAVTTAASLKKHDSIDVQLGDGTSVTAYVVSVDAQANVAVLALDEPADGAPAAMADGEPQDGDQVTVGCSDPTAAVVVQTDNGVVLDADAPVDEGAPVLDADGALVGLATTSEDGLVHLVSIPDGATAPSPPDPAELDVWLGVNFAAGGDAGSELVVTTVQEGSPAALAGIEEGDQLLAIDDAALVTIDDLWNALATYDPDDVVTVAVQRNAAMLTLTVTLGARPS